MSEQTPKPPSTSVAIDASESRVGTPGSLQWELCDLVRAARFGVEGYVVPCKFKSVVSQQGYPIASVAWEIVDERPRAVSATYTPRFPDDEVGSIPKHAPAQQWARISLAKAAMPDDVETPDGFQARYGRRGEIGNHFDAVLGQLKGDQRKRRVNDAYLRRVGIAWSDALADGSLKD